MSAKLLTDHDKMLQFCIMSFTFGLPLTNKEIQIMKAQTYQNIVESKIQSAVLKYLKGKVKSKGKQINYGEQFVLPELFIA